MRIWLVVVAMLFSATAWAQSSAPAPTGGTPMVGDRPLVQIKPKGAKAAKPKPSQPKPDAEGAAAAEPAAKPARPVRAAKPAKPPKASVAERMQGCLELDDGTKERLTCFDEIYPAKPPKAGTKLKPAKGVADCRLLKEEDERLACYNGFAESVPKLPKR
jgi:hypothetical protein